MGIETESLSAKFAARLSEITRKTYVGLDGRKTPYIQAGHAAAIDAALADNQLSAAMSILTTTEDRASVVAKIRYLSDEKRGTFQLPEAGSADESKSLKALSGRLTNIARTESLQTADATFIASLKGRSSETIAEASPSH